MQSKKKYQQDIITIIIILVIVISLVTKIQQYKIRVGRGKKIRFTLQFHIFYEYVYVNHSS